MAQEINDSRYTFNASLYTKDSDGGNFIIPLIQTHTGMPAQIRAASKGLYKDIQRSPFIRKSGVFTKDGTIPDINISALVHYGTLEQAKIAPTLENVDIRLYFREPKLTKVPDTSNSTDPDSFADNYIWREIPVGFHVYNNDTVYGYEWIVLQNDYVHANVDDDGIYTLHMNIEDGLGVCKFAGTQAPISLKGVQYKIIITAKNLWNREYSLLESMPLSSSLTENTDSLAPSVNAVREHYEKAVHTKELVTDTIFISPDASENEWKELPKDPLLSLTEKSDGIYIKKLKLGEITDAEQFLNALEETMQGHIRAAIDGGEVDEHGFAVGVHGILNKGAKGNIDAKTLAGASLSNGVQSVVENVDTLCYIPFVDVQDTIGLGTTIKQFKHSSGKNPVPYFQSRLSASDSTKTLVREESSLRDELSSFLDIINVGATTINFRFATVSSTPTITVTSGGNESGTVNLDIAKVTTDEIDFGGGFKITANKVQQWNGGSTVAYKDMHSELIGIKLKSVNNRIYSDLEPNINRDADGNSVSTVHTNNLADDALKVPTTNDLPVPKLTDVNAWTKLGSALQALYELPLGTYQYKRGGEEFKEQLGIFVERVNQVRDHLIELAGETLETENNGLPAKDNYVVHKRNTWLKSKNSNVRGNDVGLGSLSDSSDPYNLRVENNAYSYTKEELNSIVSYLNLLTSRDELAQEIRNTVGVLLMAAKETQERLLDVETAVYGWDAKTVPGNDAGKEKFIENQIAEALRSDLTNSPLLLGLNRLMRALLLEVYDTTDLERIDAEIESRVTDSDKLGAKVTVKSRMDQIDEIMNVLYSQQSALVKFYVENILNDESSHSYTDIVSKDGKKRISELQLKEKADDWTDENLTDDHSELRDRDEGRTWRNLPSKEDVTTEAKGAVKFAQVASSAHKHTPNKAETGLVRVPALATDTDNVSEGDVEHVDKSAYSGETNRTWDLFKLNKYKTEVTDDYASAGSYLPYFRTKEVAWDSAKIERMNTKLSEVTKTIYGTDDVTASLPNRTEVLRRNITNLVDDLYPNRSFKIENPIAIPSDDSANIFLPFKSSKIQNLSNVSAKLNPTTDEPEHREHTSIITWFDNELFNFKVVNHYIGKTLKTSLGTDDYATNTQVKLNERSDYNLIFDTGLLVTDEKPFAETYGTYRKAYSRLDMLENLIGVKDCYITDLYGDTEAILATGNSNLGSSLDKLALGYTSAMQVAQQQAAVAKAQSTLDNLNIQKAYLQDQIKTKQKEIDSLTTALTEARNRLSELKSAVFDQDAANAAETAAKNEVTRIESLIRDKQAEIAQLNTELSAIVAEINLLDSSISSKEQDIRNKEDEIEALESQNKDAANNLTLIEGMQEVYNNYKPLQENKSFVLKDWIELQSGRTDLTAADYITFIENKSAKTVSYSGSACNAEDGYAADDFTLTIEKRYTKHAAVESLVSTHGGTDYQDVFQTYKLVTEYYFRSDTANVLYYDRELKNVIPTPVVLDEGTIVELEELVAAETEEKVTKAEDGTESKETVVTKEAVVLKKATEAILWVKDQQYTDKEAVQVSKLVYNLKTGACYKYVEETVTMASLQFLSNVVAVDLHEAVKFTKIEGKSVNVNGTVLQDSDYSNYVAVDNAIVLYEKVTQPISYKLDYSIKYTVNWEGTGATPRVSGEVNTEYPYARVYSWEGTATVTDLNNLNQTITFTKATESFVCNSTVDWTDIDKAVEATENDLKEANAKAQRVKEDIPVVDTTQLKNELNTLESELVALKDSKNKKSSDKASKEVEIATANAELTGLQSDLTSAIEKQAEATKVAANVGAAKIENEQQQADVEASIEQLEETKTKANTELDSLNASLSSTESSIVTAEANLKTQQDTLNAVAGSAVDKTALPFYAAELTFTNFVKQKNITASLDFAWALSEDIQKSSNVGYVLSRKSKTLQERITTVEAFLDILAKSFNYEVDIRGDKKEQEDKQNSNPVQFEKNAPFEAVSPWKSLKRIFDTAENKQLDHRIYDLDLSESWKEDNVDFTEHNRKVWQVMRFSRYATKGSFVLSSENYMIGSYTISNIQLAADPSLLPYQDPEYLAGWTKFNEPKKIINVVYLKPKQTRITTANAAKDTIYLSGKTPVTTYKNFYKQSNTENAALFLNTASGLGWQNQTEYNVYKTLSNLFTSLLNSGESTIQAAQNENNLYFQLMKLVYPVGSVYMDTRILGAAAKDPNNLFGGTWLQVEESVIESASIPDNVIVRAGKVGINAATPLVEMQTPPHVHGIGSHTHGMRHRHNFNTDNNADGNPDGIVRRWGTGKSSGSGNGGGSTYYTSEISASYEGASTTHTAAATGNTATTYFPEGNTNLPIETKNLPNFKVATWVRIA